MSRRTGPRVDAGPVVTHLRNLSRQGGVMTRVAQHASCHVDTVHKLHAGAFDTINEDIAAAILAVTIDQVRREAQPTSDDTVRTAPRMAVMGRLQPEEWMQTPGKPCAGRTSAWFRFSPDGQQDAADRCQACPVIAECDRYADDHHIEEGVWGGLTEQQRRARARRVAQAGAA